MRRKVESYIGRPSFSYMLQFVCRPENRGKKVNDAFDISWIDWLEFIFGDVVGRFFFHPTWNLMLNMSRNHFYLPPSLPFDLELLLTFNFIRELSPDNNICVQTLTTRRMRISREYMIVQQRLWLKYLKQFSCFNVFLFYAINTKNEILCANIIWNEDVLLRIECMMCSYTVHECQPTTTARTTLISRLSSHVFSIVFFISIHAGGFDKNIFSPLLAVQYCHVKSLDLFMCLWKNLHLNASDGNWIIMLMIVRSTHCAVCFVSEICSFLKHGLYVASSSRDWKQFHEI